MVHGITKGDDYVQVILDVRQKYLIQIIELTGISEEEYGKLDKLEKLEKTVQKPKETLKINLKGNAKKPRIRWNLIGLIVSSMLIGALIVALFF